MYLNTDRLFFDPYPIALIKGLAYGLAYGTSIMFSNIKEKDFYFALIIYFAGSLCDFFELGFFNEKKSSFVKRTSRIMFVIFLILIIFLLCIIYGYNTDNKSIYFLNVHIKHIKIIFSFLFIWPLTTGIYMMLKKVPPDTKIRTEIPQKVNHGLGYRVKPQ